MDSRLETAKNIWLASVKPNGRPHLVPIWFVWVDERAYVCTSHKSVKARNIAANSSVTFALEDGNKPVIGVGEARIQAPPYPEAVIQAFKAKFDWDISSDASYDALIEIEVSKWLAW